MNNKLNWDVVKMRYNFVLSFDGGSPDILSGDIIIILHNYNVIHNYIHYEVDIHMYMNHLTFCNQVALGLVYSIP